MRLLLHVGLNKCASTFMQERLAASADALARAGVLYARERGRTCHYGLSRHYGFGPDAADVRPHPLQAYLRLARRRGLDAVILSSEYLSLKRPAAIAALVRDIRAEGVTPEVLFYVRPVEPWVRSLFNQYVRTVDGPRWLPSIDAYVDQVLQTGAIDVAGRYRAWLDAAGAGAVRLIDIAEEDPAEAVLAPFEAFAGIPLPDRGGTRANRGLAPGALYLMGLVRRAPPSPARDLLLESLGQIARPLAGWVPVPAGYLAISADRRARLAREIAAPLAALPRAPAAAPAEAAPAGAA